jgi:hypothetical protein
LAADSAPLAPYDAKKAGGTVTLVAQAAAGTLDPKILARGYLSKAGYPSKAVDSISGLLKKADENFKLEKQMTATPLSSDGKITPPVPQ